MTELPYYDGFEPTHSTVPPLQVPQTTETSEDGDGEPRPKKQKRIRRACDFCHARSTKCRQNPQGPSCLVCLEFRQPCTYDRPEKKRGVPGKQYRPPVSIPGPDTGITESPLETLPSGEMDARLLLDLNNRAQADVNPAEQPPVVLVEESTFDRCKALAISAEKHIKDLVELYFEYVQPM